MRLRDVLACIQPRKIRDREGGIVDVLPEDRLETPIAAVHYRSQEVTPGSLFVAISGSRVDGNVFVPMAVSKGAVCIVSEQLPQADGAVVLQVENARKALARIAARYYGDPSRNLIVIAVTGTNGKTTTAFLIEHILQQAGYRTGVIGTLNARYADTVVDIGMTTPESLDLQRLLHDMRAAGVTHVVMEASSHAIALDRIEGCRIDVGILTNVTQDHLDFHGTMDAYWEAKKKLFTHHLMLQDAAHRIQSPVAVINRRDPKGAALCGELSCAVIDVGLTSECRVRAIPVRIDASGIEAVMSTPQGLVHINSSLIGEHNLENILCAVGAASALDLSLKTIREGIESVVSVPGRLERVPNAAKRLVVVDYAHTPDALDHALKTLHRVTAGKLICVFGCGGDRDRGKRPIMGQIAAKWADAVIVTSDNPRTEEPIAIIEAIAEGLTAAGWERADGDHKRVEKNGERFWVEPDRRKAIRQAIAISKRSDTVLIAGKGHETYQIIGLEHIPFDDRIEASNALKELTDSSKPSKHP
uniref:UDP-N-acetylmuramoyl-L-alanyl-D-glutamate--2,6-diaminopimelate ligase n=1 Tax=Desulfatirhabdium butyrativorans TaxID=340467 RepID=A0A7C4RMZ1_9BACT